MKRAIGLLAVVLLLLLVPAHAAGLPPRPVAEVTTMEERGGVIRVDEVTHDWFIIDTPAHHNEGLTGIDCSATTGAITVMFVPLTNLITAFVDEDESYTAVYEGGASVGLDRFVITIRRGSNGAIVPCYAAELRIHNSNFWVWVKGRVVVVAPPPTTPPATTTMPPVPSSPPPIG